MKKESYSILLIMLLMKCALVTGQDYVKFRYDQNGNRISRSLIVEQLNISDPDFPIAKHEDLEKAEEVIGDEILIFPNPVKNKLNIQFKGYDDQNKRRIELYALSGAKVYLRENCENTNVVDVSALDSGVYILRIEVGLQKYFYKLIKSK